MLVIRTVTGYFIGQTRACLFALLYTLVYFQVFYHWHGPKIDNRVRQIEGQVVALNALSNSQFVTLKLNQIDQYKVPFYQRVIISVPVAAKIEVALGTQVKAQTRVRHKKWRVNFAVRDARIYGFLHGPHLVASKPVTVEIETVQSNIAQRYRSWLDTHLRDYQLYGVYKALLSADRSAISEEDRQLFRDTGTIHLLAISGLHIALLYAFCFYGIKLVLWLFSASLFRGLPQAHSINGIVALIALILCALFVLLCQLPISAQRAWLMLALFVALYFSRLRYQLGHSLLLALTLVLVINPFALLDVGMWFSFFAVAVIFVVLRLSTGRHWLVRYLWVQLSLCLGLAPLSLLVFGGLSWSAALFNLLFVPLVSFILLPLLILTALSAFRPWLMACLGAFDTLAAKGVAFLLPVSEHFWWSSSHFSLAVVLACYIAILAMLMLRSLWPASYALVLLTAFTSIERAWAPSWQMDVLDVGHGLSIVVSRGRKALVYDLGASYFGRYSIVDNTLLPFIQSENLSPELTLLSHRDNDHAGGLRHWRAAGYGETLARFHPGGRLTCNQHALNWHGLELTPLWPKFAGTNDNANSCVLLISDGTYKVLLSGDISMKEEAQLVTLNALTPVDVLVSPHHGSRTSSSAAYINVLSPSEVIHSSSARTNWQMPHPDVVARYQAVGARQWLTKTQGGIRVQFYRDKIVIKAAKEQKNYWFIMD
ncbi:DNA internalization-related competence protein ComEC/Rec2 [Pseudoalteromonas sp. T1lg48]|uniref:DNA internalization-related competence protein ComEC/Rec2 n=1 Tax=Pseudoalteromonas sp. T1lg48 TaxID=2077100 RepID=UPI001319BBA1|nr:DNA internalization-related competence protein ComEC/Rec2 [Pseudoalteromonas sp. T1lg48]